MGTDWETASTASFAAMDKVTKAELTELKSLGKPPVSVGTTLAAVQIILGEADTSWKGSQKAMNNPVAFFDKVKAFDLQTMDKARMMKLKKLLADNPDFEFEKAQESSKATGGLAMWAAAVWNARQDLIV